MYRLLVVHSSLAGVRNRQALYIKLRMKLWHNENLSVSALLEFYNSARESVVLISGEKTALHVHEI